MRLYTARQQPWQCDRTTFTKKDQVMAPVKPETKVQSMQLKSRRMIVWGQQSLGQARMGDDDQSDHGPGLRRRSSS